MRPSARVLFVFCTLYSTSYYIRLRDERTGARVTLELSPAGYRAAAVGARFSRTFFAGRLGVPYRWTLGFPPVAEL